MNEEDIVMGRVNALYLAAAVIFGGANVAQAADFLPPRPQLQEPPRVAALETSGWYLRGDIGMSVDQSAQWDMVPGRLLGSAGYNPTAYGPSKAHVSNNVFVGLGFGYQVNSWFRADITGEYRGASRFSSNAELTFDDTAGTTTVLRTFNRGDLSSIVGLVNGYIDLGTWHGVTPYVGAGVGIARNKIDGMVDQGYFVSTGVAPATGTTGGFYGAGAKTNFAWALMAGLGYDVSSRLKLELGYRYLNAGKATTGALTCFGVPGCGNTYLVTKKNENHDIKIGMRWMLSDSAPVMEDMPLVRKY